MQLRTQLKTLYQRLEDAGLRPNSDDIETLDIPLPSDAPQDAVADRGMFRALAETLKEQIDAIHDTGCTIKDVEEGLVDWPTMHDGREVLLCWKYGEQKVAHWHELGSGFAGRRPVSELGGSSN